MEKTVKKIREKSGLSVIRFSKKYGIPYRTLHNWETGDRKPPEYVLKLLERVVEIDTKTEDNE